MTLHYAGLVGGIVSVSTIGPQLVAAPPYLWGSNAGLINVGGLVGSIIGALYAYAVVDSMLKRSARREHGAAEPESRLPTMFPTLAIATCGFLIFGFCAEHPSKNTWVGLQVGYAMIAMGLMQVPSVGFNYVSNLMPDFIWTLTKFSHSSSTATAILQPIVLSWLQFYELLLPSPGPSLSVTGSQSAERLSLLGYLAC